MQDVTEAIAPKITSRWLTVGLPILLLALLLYWSYQLLYPDSATPWIFPDFLNLLIHEAGHWLFWPLGEFMHVFGGSLNQCLIPAIFLGYFIYKKDWLGSGFCLFWLGDNLINVSVYINDAQTMTLPLLGGDGVIHDWNWLLNNLGWLESSSIIAGLVHGVGAICLTASIVCFGLVITYHLMTKTKPSTDILTTEQ